MKSRPKSFAELVSPDAIRESSLRADGRPISGVTADSSAVVPGSIFFAIPGTKIDGHEFIGDAFAKGAAAVVAENAAALSWGDVVTVENTRAAFALASARWFDHPTSQLKLVGITGTNGKTTTTYLLRDIWRASRREVGIVGTVQYQVGSRIVESKLTTPGPYELQRLFSEMVAAGVTHAAMEVSSIALDQFRPWGTQFGAAIFTNLTQDHLDYHGDYERYFAAKRRLFVDYELPIAIINVDDPWGRRLRHESGARRTLSLGVEGGDAGADYFLRDVLITRNGMSARLVSPAGEFDFKTPLLGRHNLYNCLGAIAAGVELGEPMDVVLAAIAESRGAPGRLELVTQGTDKPTVFVDYAHSTDALANVLRSLNDLRNSFSGRIITVFGCGGDRDRGKRPEMGRVASEFSDVTVVTSDNPRTEDPQAILNEIEVGILRGRTQYLREVDRRLAIRLALQMAEPQDVVLIAGKGHENYQILGTRTVPFDDAQEVRHYYQP